MNNNNVKGKSYQPYDEEATHALYSNNNLGDAKNIVGGASETRPAEGGRGVSTNVKVAVAIVVFIVVLGVLFVGAYTSCCLPDKKQESTTTKASYTSNQTTPDLITTNIPVLQTTLPVSHYYNKTTIQSNMSYATNQVIQSTKTHNISYITTPISHITIPSYKTELATNLSYVTTQTLDHSYSKREVTSQSLFETLFTTVISSQNVTQQLATLTKESDNFSTTDTVTTTFTSLLTEPTSVQNISTIRPLDITTEYTAGQRTTKPDDQETSKMNITTRIIQTTPPFTITHSDTNTTFFIPTGESDATSISKLTANSSIPTSVIANTTFYLTTASLAETSFITKEDSNKTTVTDIYTITSDVETTTTSITDVLPVTYGVNLNENRKLHNDGKFRAGQATDTDSCDTVREVPPELRSKEVMWPQGILGFYQKYTEAYGIPVIGSRNVTDVGLRRACYVMRYMLSSRYDIRNSIYKFFGRIALIADNEEQSSLPEYRNFDDRSDRRMRGLGPTISKPLSSAGDDNMRCAEQDRYPEEDVMVHEVTHAVHLIGASFVVPGFDNRLYTLYNNSMRLGKYGRLYMTENAKEYLAQGAGIYFGTFIANFKGKNGLPQTLKNREELAEYDPDLVKLFDELFPCPNFLIPRCPQKTGLACNMSSFRKFYDESANYSLSCKVDRSYTGISTIEECAVKTCRRLQIVFMYKNDTCLSMSCPGTLPLVSTSDSYNIYALKAPYTMNTEMEDNQKLEQLCTRPVISPSVNCDVSVNKRSQCGPVEQTREQCQARGCCYDNNTCFYSQLSESCIDDGSYCYQQAHIGYCDIDPGRMHVNCPVSCNLCITGSPYSKDELKSMCQDKLSYCMSMMSRCDSSLARSKCKLTCGYCSRSPASTTTKTIPMTTTINHSILYTSPTDDNSISYFQSTSDSIFSSTSSLNSLWPVTFGGSLSSADHPHGSYRSGEATDSNSCGYVRQVPGELRNASVMFDGGINEFYQKYTEAYGIPIVGSVNVSDEGLTRACYTVRHMLASRYDIRNSVYKFFNKIALIGDDEQLTSLYEYRNWNKSWDTRTRGIGATTQIPLTSVGDNNQKCSRTDRYPDNDILVHEFAHTIHRHGARVVIPGFEERLTQLYEEAKQKNMFKNTYAMTDKYEFWAVQTEFYFGTYQASGYTYNINGTNVAIRSERTLRMYNPKMVDLLQEVYSCPNSFMKRCTIKEAPYCSFSNYQLMFSSSLNQVVQCPADVTYRNVLSVRECARRSCLRSANYFMYKRRSCKLFVCDAEPTMTTGNSRHSVYKLISEPTIAIGALEQEEVIQELCSRPIDNQERCNVSSREGLEECGPNNQTATECERRGCCYIERHCVYSPITSGCIDTRTDCAPYRDIGYCSNKSFGSFMKEFCPVSCNDGVCLV